SLRKCTFSRCPQPAKSAAVPSSTSAICARCSGYCVAAAAGASSACPRDMRNAQLAERSRATRFAILTAAKDDFTIILFKGIRWPKILHFYFS
ncbi:hypothetical protein PMAYCL1PPCAC_09677, partial [Pristionchus mayeri]